MREKGIDTGVNFLVSRFVLDLAVFDVDGIHRGDRDLGELGTVVRNLKTNGAIIADVDEREQNKKSDCDGRKWTFHFVFRTAFREKLTLTAEDCVRPVL